jgi:secreted trypsin-like serine protease
MRCSIAADGQEPLYSGCNGDSGGPLWTGTTAPVQLGVSWGGDRGGADHLPSVFADVAR